MSGAAASMGARYRMARDRSRQVQDCRPRPAGRAPRWARRPATSARSRTGRRRVQDGGQADGPQLERPVAQHEVEDPPHSPSAGGSGCAGRGLAERDRGRGGRRWPLAGRGGLDGALVGGRAARELRDPPSVAAPAQDWAVCRARMARPARRCRRPPVAASPRSQQGRRAQPGAAPHRDRARSVHARPG